MGIGKILFIFYTAISLVSFMPSPAIRDKIVVNGRVRFHGHNFVIFEEYRVRGIYQYQNFHNRLCKGIPNNYQTL